MSTFTSISAVFTLLPLFASISAVACCEYFGYRCPELPVNQPGFRTGSGTAFFMRTLGGSGWVSQLHDESMRDAGWDWDRETVFIIHGYNSNILFPWVLGTQRAVLEEFGCNVIAVDWNAKALGNLGIVAQDIFSFIVWLMDTKKLELGRVHLVGSGLGAHLAGRVGNLVKFLGSQAAIDRITALNPSAFGVGDWHPLNRLSVASANLVVVIHTGTRQSLRLPSFVGIERSFGHVDFFPNGGSGQPDCGWSDPVCDHEMAKMLFIKSIKYDKHLFGVPCRSYDEFKAGRCTPCNGDCLTFGYSAERILGQSRSNAGSRSSGGTIPTGNFYLLTPSIFSLHRMRMIHLSVLVQSNQSLEFSAQLRYISSYLDSLPVSIDLTGRHSLNVAFNAVISIFKPKIFELKIETAAVRLDRIEAKLTDVGSSDRQAKSCIDNPPVGSFVQLLEWNS